MANNLLYNPLRIDTAATIIVDATGNTLIQSMQWIDDNSSAGGRIEDGDDLAIKFNDVPFKLNCRETASIAGSMAYSVNFNPGMRTFKLEVTKIDGGTLLIWKAFGNDVI